MNEFEKMMEELTGITEKLESGKLTLSESMELFEKGVSLTKKCSELLEKRKNQNNENNLRLRGSGEGRTV